MDWKFRKRKKCSSRIVYSFGVFFPDWVYGEFRRAWSPQSRVWIYRLKHSLHDPKVVDLDACIFFYSFWWFYVKFIYKIMCLRGNCVIYIHFFFLLNNSQFMMPGMIDTHIHASQFPNNGVAMDLPLLEWLQTYTFPTEANFSDTLFAREVYSKVVVSIFMSFL